MKKKISIFDHCPIRRYNLEVLINMCSDMECVGSFATPVRMLLHIESKQPDLILMDTEMPEGNSIAIIKKIKFSLPDLPVLIQTENESEAHIFETIKAGANGYILKSTPPDKLLEQIRNTINGGSPISDKIAQKLFQYFRREVVDTHYNLSPKEKDVLAELVNGQSQKLIAHQLHIKPRTVSNHINSIYHKLQVHSATEAVSLALKKKLV